MIFCQASDPGLTTSGDSSYRGADRGPPRGAVAGGEKRTCTPDLQIVDGGESDGIRTWV